MKRLIKKIRHITSKDYAHRQYVIFTAALALLLLAFTFNRYVINRSTIYVTVAYPEITMSLDGQTISPKQVDADTYKFTTIPGKHTLSIKSGDEINHKEVITARAGFTTSITPALTIAPNPESDEIGEVDFISQSVDHTKLFYLGKNGTTLVSYDIPTRIRTAISDGVFSNVTDLSWAPDHSAVITRDRSTNWYFFNFTKPDFITTSLRFLSDPTVTDISFDPAHERIGLIQYKGLVPVFATADIGLQERNVLVDLEKLKAPQINWSPNGRIVALLDDSHATLNNLYFYDLAANSLTASDLQNVTRLSFSPDARSALVEVTSDGHPSLFLVNIETAETKEIGQLAVSGGAVWHSDSASFTALLKTAEKESSLEKIAVADLVHAPYAVSLHVPTAIETIFIAEDESTVYFLTNKHLYSFPLIVTP